MPIEVDCSNGHRLVVKESLVGKKIKCPKCNTVLLVPSIAESNNTESNWLLEDFPVSSSPAVLSNPIPASQRPIPESVPLQQSKLNPRVLVMAIAGAGTVLTVLLIAVGAYLVLSGNNEPAQSSTLSAMPLPVLPSEPIATDPIQEEQAPRIPTSEPLVSKPEVAPALPANLLNMTKVPADESALCFRLPTATWASAYDEVTGRLAVTNDAKGILIYSVEDLREGKMEPLQVLPTPGIATAVCFKRIGEKRLFVYAGMNASTLFMVDADSLQPYEDLSLKDTTIVIHLAGSLNPNDPMIYFTSIKQSSDNRSTAILGRADLVSRKQDEGTEDCFLDCSVSPDGSLIFARSINESAMPICGTWKDVLQFSRLPGSTINDNPLAFSEDGIAPTKVLRDALAIGTSVYQPGFNRQDMTWLHKTETDFVPAAAFTSVPILIGAGRQDVVIGSANHYGRLASIPLPNDLLNREDDDALKQRFNDTRYRPGICQVLSSTFYDAMADDSRRLGIVLFDEYLVLAPLGQLSFAAEPFLSCKQKLPNSIVAGEQLKIELHAEAPDATFQYVPNADWLADRRFRVFGSSAQSIPEIQLLQEVDWNAKRIGMSGFETQESRDMPFDIRVGDEIMTVLSSTENSFRVRRTRQIKHSVKARVELIEKGTPDPMLPKMSRGRELGLRAEIQPKQERIYVTELRQFSGRTLPFKIQIGKEIMLVTEADDYTNSLVVQRTKDIGHDVSESAFVLNENETTNLPRIDGNSLSWTPPMSMVGKHNLRIRAKSGDASCDWIWPLEVLPAKSPQFPFYVRGIDAESGTNQAVVWGSAKAPDGNDKKEVEPSSVLCIYDTKSMTILEQTEVKYFIGSAVLHSTGIYASAYMSSASELDALVRKKGKNVKLRTGTTEAAFTRGMQILRLDRKSFKILDYEKLSSDGSALKVIGDANLVAGNARYSIPNLTLFEEKARSYPYPIHGQLNDGWVLDGVVWNEKMTQPRLLLFPVHFDNPDVVFPGEFYRLPGIKKGRVGAETNGPFVGVWEPKGFSRARGYPIKEYASVLERKNTGIDVYPYNILGVVGGTQRAKSFPFPSNPSSNRRIVEGTQEGRKEFGTMSEADGILYVASQGRINTFLVSELAQAKNDFHFVEEQSSFVLETGKPIKLKYSAPGAVKYHFAIWLTRPNHLFNREGTFDGAKAEAVYSGESSDGSFEFSIETANIVSLALQRALGGVKGSSVKERQSKIIAYLKEISAPYKDLTGKSPKSVPVPAYVALFAEHENGYETAGLLHSYLLEPPFKEIQKAIEEP